ncbi:hypothetical protein CSC14_0097 [Proteus mirabilis]|nr:hypothetical protein CSC14_0097 [Proteus mirabilis]
MIATFRDKIAKVNSHYYSPNIINYLIKTKKLTAFIPLLLVIFSKSL